jgi:thiamine kinase-like enzyme
MGMMHRWVISICSIFCCLVGCTPNQPSRMIDRKDATNVVQNALIIDEPVIADEILSGHSGNQLFLATAGHNKYVVRFFENPSQARREIDCQNIASIAGYGPRVFVADPDQGYIVMEYVPQVAMDQNQFSSNQRYQALGEAVFKLHHGPKFPEKKGSIFDDIHSRIRKLKKRASFEPVAVRLEEMISVIQKTVSSSPNNKTSCHNDLHPGNMIFSGSSFKIIDFGDATQDDPYFDLATVIVFNCFHPEQEEAILTAYFKRPMLPEEKAKLTLMKQAVFICWATRGFLENDQLYDEKIESKIASETFPNLLKKSWIGDDLAKQEVKSLAPYIFFREAVNRFQSQEFIAP